MAVVVVGFVLVPLIVAFAWGWQHRGKAPSTPKPLVTWEITVPREARFTPPQAAAWFASLRPLLQGDGAHLTLELRSQARHIRLLITAPSRWEVPLRSQLAAWFPGARLEQLSNSEALLDRGSLQLLAPQAVEIIPISAQGSGEADPLLGLLGILAHADGACGLRLTLRGEPKHWMKWRNEALLALKAGRSPSNRRWPRWWRVLHELLLDTWRAKPVAPETLAFAARKADTPVFEGRIGVWAHHTVAREEDALRQRLTGYLTGAFADPRGNRLEVAGDPTPLQNHDLEALSKRGKRTIPAEEFALPPSNLSLGAP